jgi:predicted HicB family RNase H-like nuclease
MKTEKGSPLPTKKRSSEARGRKAAHNHGRKADSALNMRVPGEFLAAWKCKAKASKKPLSAWVIHRLNS